MSSGGESHVAIADVNVLRCLSTACFTGKKSYFAKLRPQFCTQLGRKAQPQPAHLYADSVNRQFPYHDKVNTFPLQAASRPLFGASEHGGGRIKMLPADAKWA